MMGTRVVCSPQQGDPFACNLSNVSPAGLNLSSSHSVTKGDKLQIELTAPVPLPPPAPPRLVLSCEVTWQRTSESEVQFGVRWESMRMDAMKDLFRFVYGSFGLRLWEWPEKREHPRVSRKLVCHILDGDKMQVAMLRDLSITGLGLLTLYPMAEGYVGRFRYAVSEDFIVERAARIMRCRKTDEGYDLGVAYAEMTEEERQEVVEALARAVRI